MADRKRILILGGTGEARALAEGLAERTGVDVVTSLAGRTKSPAEVAGETRSGGFGGAEGLADYMRTDRIDVLVDATHPFATEISRNAEAACARLDVPRLMLIRPPWPQEPGDEWIEVGSMNEAATRLAAFGRRVFLTTGQKDLAPMAQLADRWFLIRLVDPPDKALPLADYKVITARGPFSEADERAVMTEHGIEVVVGKNSGGAATYGKITKTRALGLPLIMIARPPAPPGKVVETVDAAMPWLDDALG